MDKSLLYMFDFEKGTNKKNIPPESKLQSASYSKMYKKEKLKKIKANNEMAYFEEVPEREREIRIAIELRFQKSRMNQEYFYNDCERPSSHSSEMKEYDHLKTIHFYNLADQNKIKKKAVDDKQILPNQKSTLKKFKVNPGDNNNNGIRKTQGDQVSDKKIINSWVTKIKESGNKSGGEKSESPVNLLAKYLFKHNNKTKQGKEKKLNLSTGESSKLETLNSPSVQKNKNQGVRYPFKKNPKQTTSRESSNSQSSGFKSNLTLHLEFKKKQTSNNKTTSSATRLNTLNTSSGKVPLQATDKKKDNLFRAIFSKKLK